MADTSKQERAAEVRRILDHAKTKSRMDGRDDAITKPLFTMLKRDGFIPTDSAGYLEWQGAWEHGVACYFFGEDHCLNVDIDGEVCQYA